MRCDEIRLTERGKNNDEYNINLIEAWQEKDPLTDKERYPSSLFGIGARSCLRCSRKWEVVRNHSVTKHNWRNSQNWHNSRRVHAGKTFYQYRGAGRAL